MVEDRFKLWREVVRAIRRGQCIIEYDKRIEVVVRVNADSLTANR